EIDEAERNGGAGLCDAGEAETPGRERDGNHEHGVEESFDDGGPSVGLDDGQHANAGAGVVVAVEPGNRHEMRELPDEEDGEESDARPLDAAASSGPAKQGAHSARKCADER